MTDANTGEYALCREMTVCRPRDRVFEFFSTAENLETITPPWLRFRIDTPWPIAMRQGARIAYRLRLHGMPIRWLTEIEQWQPPYEFVDVQREGPYHLWRHTHRFEETGWGTRIIDLVHYTLPFGPLGRLVHRLQVAEDLAEIFDYRERRVRTLLR